jgi:hypothetical protein
MQQRSSTAGDQRQSSGELGRAARTLHLRDAIAGGDVLGRIARLVRGIAAFGNLRELDRRMQQLARAGVIEQLPNRWQLVAGIVDMLRFWVVPAAGGDAAAQDSHLAYYQLVRFVAEPATILDPVGLFTERDMIVRHVMQVAHDNPGYDLELLHMFDDGVEELVRQLDAVLAGTHPRARTVRAIVEEPDYPVRLRRYLDLWRRDRKTPFASRRVVGDAERTFATVAVLVRYMNRLPRTAIGAIRHLATTRTLSPALAEPQAVTTASS